MKRLLLAAFAVPLGLGAPQEHFIRPNRVIISGASYKTMHQEVPVYGGAAHVADVLYAIGDAHDFVEVEVPVIAPLGRVIPQHPAIASGRLLHRLDVERIRMTKFNAVESKDANGATCIEMTATFAFEMPPAEDHQLAAEIIGLALGFDPRIEVMSQPQAIASGLDGNFEIPDLALRVATPEGAGEPPIGRPRPKAPQEKADLEGLSGSFPGFVRMCAQDEFVKLGPLAIAAPQQLAASDARPEGLRYEVRTVGKADAKINLAKIANFTMRIHGRSRRARQVGLSTQVDEEGALKVQALFDIR